MTEKDIIERTVINCCIGTNVSFWQSSDIDDGLEIILVDALEKGIDFEIDIEALMKHLKEKLNANVKISRPHFYEETDVNDLNGEKFTNYYCSIDFEINK